MVYPPVVSPVGRMPVPPVEPPVVSPVCPPRVAVPVFDGSVLMRTYLCQFDVVSEYFKWTDEQKLLYFVSNLRGEALNFYSSIDSATRQSFDSVIGHFMWRFGDNVSDNTFYRDLLKMKIGRGESYEAFAGRVYSVAARASKGFHVLGATSDGVKFIETLSVDNFIRGIGDVLKDRVRYDLNIARHTRNISSLKEALEFLRHLESCWNQTFGTVVDSDVDSVKSSPKISRFTLWKKKLTCHKCGELGHMKKECPLRN